MTDYFDWPIVISAQTSSTFFSWYKNCSFPLKMQETPLIEKEICMIVIQYIYICMLERKKKWVDTP